MVAAAGAGVFSPSKGYHFEDSPYVEYVGVLPDGMDKNAFQEKVRSGGEKGDLDTTLDATAGLPRGVADYFSFAFRG